MLLKLRGCVAWGKLSWSWSKKGLKHCLKLSSHSIPIIGASYICMLFWRNLQRGYCWAFDLRVEFWTTTNEQCVYSCVLTLHSVLFLVDEHIPLILCEPLNIPLSLSCLSYYECTWSLNSDLDVHVSIMRAVTWVKEFYSCSMPKRGDCKLIQHCFCCPPCITVDSTVMLTHAMSGS